MISILHPSRGRPHQSFATIKKWIVRSGVPLEVLLSTDKSDITEITYFDKYNTLDYPFRWVQNENRNAIEAINRAANIAHFNILIVVSDDTDCPLNWGLRLLAAIGDKKDFVLKTDDGIQRTMITMPIMDRTYFNRDGYIYNPIYDHLFADKEFSDVAYARKRVIKKMGLKFPHKHYSRTGQTPDEVHLKNELTYEPGKKLYLERKKIHFGL